MPMGKRGQPPKGLMANAVKKPSKEMTQSITRFVQETEDRFRVWGSLQKADDIPALLKSVQSNLVLANVQGLDRLSARLLKLKEQLSQEERDRDWRKKKQEETAEASGEESDEDEEEEEEEDEEQPPPKDQKQASLPMSPTISPASSSLPSPSTEEVKSSIVAEDKSLIGAAKRRNKGDLLELLSDKVAEVLNQEKDPNQNPERQYILENDYRVELVALSVEEGDFATALWLITNLRPNLDGQIKGALLGLQERLLLDDASKKALVTRFAAEGDTKAVFWLVKRLGARLDDAMESAGKAGRILVLKNLFVHSPRDLNCLGAAILGLIRGNHHLDSPDVEAGSYNIVEDLLDELNKRDKSGAADRLMKAIQVAASTNNPKLLESLLKRPEVVGIRGYGPQNPGENCAVSAAAEGNHFDLVCNLIDRGASVDRAISGALKMADQQSQPFIDKLLQRDNSAAARGPLLVEGRNDEFPSGSIGAVTPVMASMQELTADMPDLKYGGGFSPEESIAEDRPSIVTSVPVRSLPTPTPTWEEERCVIVTQLETLPDERGPILRVLSSIISFLFGSDPWAKRYQDIYRELNREQVSLALKADLGPRSAVNPAVKAVLQKCQDRIFPEDSKFTKKHNAVMRALQDLAKESSFLPSALSFFQGANEWVNKYRNVETMDELSQKLAEDLAEGSGASPRVKEALRGEQPPQPAGGGGIHFVPPPLVREVKHITVSLPDSAADSATNSDQVGDHQDPIP